MYYDDEGCGDYQDNLLDEGSRIDQAWIDSALERLDNRVAAMTRLAEQSGAIWRNAPNTVEGIAAAKAAVLELTRVDGTTPQELAQFITKAATGLGKRVNVNWLKNIGMERVA